MDRLTSLRLFRGVVESGSFARAAEAMGISAPMASRHIAQLERSLGTRLLHRSSRHLSLTDAGRSWYEQSSHALDLLDSAEAALVADADATPRGRLKVSAPVWFGTPRMAGLLADYHARCPEVLVDLHLANRRVDLVADGFDLALRATREPAAALIARPLCTVDFHIVAAPGYLAASGTPAQPEDLAGLGAIVPSYVQLEGRVLRAADGRQTTLRLTPVMRSDDTHLTRHAVHAGLGIAYLPAWLVDDDLAQGRLVELVPEWRGPATTLFAVYASRQHMAPALRSFIDFLVAALAPAEEGRTGRPPAAPPPSPTR
ncbi:LysR family transcriptional regulator [Pseudacidovorax intermedius]|uniref:LysR family transcriptional regulator n=1 Tax=Pseudacidovorax intermedius TaxID=433924 RepID=A0A147H7H1_9BURK|nr:LysR family transcriptional regulator [Pseudacidovorax intermedius]KTT25898.1 LysR family transcriptional regulator [Pseudacidovorax intermedius]